MSTVEAICSSLSPVTLRQSRTVQRRVNAHALLDSHLHLRAVQNDWISFLFDEYPLIELCPKLAKGVQRVSIHSLRSYSISARRTLAPRGVVVGLDEVFP